MHVPRRPRGMPSPLCRARACCLVVSATVLRAALFWLGSPWIGSRARGSFHLSCTLSPCSESEPRQGQAAKTWTWQRQGAGGPSSGWPPSQHPRGHVQSVRERGRRHQARQEKRRESEIRKPERELPARLNGSPVLWRARCQASDAPSFPAPGIGEHPPKGFQRRPPCQLAAIPRIQTSINMQRIFNWIQGRFGAVRCRLDGLDRVWLAYVTNPRMDPGRGWLPVHDARTSAQAGKGGCSTPHKLHICIRVVDLESVDGLHFTHSCTQLQLGVALIDGPRKVRDQPPPKLSLPCPGTRSPSPLRLSAMRPWLVWRR